jgi:hypothetical protein
MASLAIPFTVATLLKEVPTDNDAVVKGALVLVARQAPLGLYRPGRLNHTGEPFDPLRLSSLVNACKMCSVEASSSADLDGSSYLQFLDTLNPLVPRLYLFHGSNHIAISINNINKALRSPIIVVLNAFHTILLVFFFFFFFRSLRYHCSSISRLYSWGRSIEA